MILVTGGTGFVGSHLVPRLVEIGERVRCLVRSRAKLQGVELRLGDVTNLSSLEQAMPGVETVIHLVSVIRESKDATFDRINVQGTKNVVQAAQKSGVKQFIHMSALGATPNPKYRYTYSKWQGEEVVRSSHLDFVIFRPSVIFGRGAGLTDRLVQSLMMFPFLAPVPGSGKARFQPIWVEDVVTCIVQVLKGEKTGQTYEIGGPEHLTYQQMLDTIIQILGIKRIKVHIPLLLMYPAVMIMEKVTPNPPVTLVELAQLELDNTTDLNSVERYFGFKPLALRDGLDYIKSL
ncbi:complex I NDUFA9 subunit family protein [Dehalococcoidales bacterium]|nr:complex I NDUFA9 subunit family protein [Dehalococcoidales bacterium]